MAVSDNPSAPAMERPRRKRAAHLGPERRRPFVLDAAYELFLENGFEGTSMDAIAAAAGVSKPVVYDCFASKDELFTAMLDREEERILVETRQGARDHRRRADDPEGTLIRGFQVFLEAAQRLARHLPRRLPRRGRRQRGGRGPDLPRHRASGDDGRRRSPGAGSSSYSDLEGRGGGGGRRAPRPHDRRLRPGRRPHAPERLRRMDARRRWARSSAAWPGPPAPRSSDA